MCLEMDEVSVSKTISWLRKLCKNDEIKLLLDEISEYFSVFEETRRENCKKLIKEHEVDLVLMLGDTRAYYFEYCAYINEDGVCFIPKSVNVDCSKIVYYYEISCMMSDIFLMRVN